MSRLLDLWTAAVAVPEGPAVVTLRLGQEPRRDLEVSRKQSLVELRFVALIFNKKATDSRATLRLADL